MNLVEMTQMVSVDVPTAPLMTVRDALAWAARAFCTDADAWVVEGQPVVVAANTDYPEVLSDEGEPLRILSLALEGGERRQGEGFSQVSATSIHFDRRPSESVLYGSLACRPTVGEMPPAVVCDRWGEAFCDGARYRLLVMPQPWRDPDMARHYRDNFERAKASARQLSSLGHGIGGACVKMRRFI
ncbi:hypothetical protein [Salinicola sp. DM10]|uniref:hypothetical protein n=1 Tax=Salinicola sp. DM10 TaxID=2815721 RepID=UPI001A8FF2CB|nr:hypothetical protein [Salinicola sp. DM10]MCE3025730.1 hypothetical protein [Salinicola sp. DM10]